MNIERRPSVAATLATALVAAIALLAVLGYGWSRPGSTTGDHPARLARCGPQRIGATASGGHVVEDSSQPDAAPNQVAYSDDGQRSEAPALHRRTTRTTTAALWGRAATGGGPDVDWSKDAPLDDYFASSQHSAPRAGRAPPTA